MDKALGTSYVETLKNNLSEITGLEVGVENGFLQYTDTGGKKGSSKARKFLKDIIDSKKDKVIVNLRRGTSKAGGNVILLGQKQVKGFIDGTPKDLNNKTMGWGMTFLHELHHTTAGGGLIDVEDKTDFASTGPTVDRMNDIRQELDANSSNGSAPFGIRKHYNAIKGDNGVVKINFKYPYINKKGKIKWNYPSIKH